LRLFENRVLRRIFGAKREAVTGTWSDNEELHKSYPLPRIVRLMRSVRIR
jgi:hypothetical protein